MASEPILLVAMPWEMLEMPSIQLGTLASLLRRAGIETATASLKLPFWDACLAAGAGRFDHYDRIALGSWEVGHAHRALDLSKGPVVWSSRVHQDLLAAPRLRSDREAEGTGLGLALCRKFVELHVGESGWRARWDRAPTAVPAGNRPLPRSGHAGRGTAEKGCSGSSAG